jgi:hypothetical protein
MTYRSSRLALLVAAFTLGVPAAALGAVPAPPLQLPGDGAAATARADGASWIVGARPGPAATRLARAHGARHVGPAGTGGYSIPREHARAFADALRARDLLVYAQPNVLRHTAAMPEDPLDQVNWRDRIVDPTLTPPAVGPASPLIALVDAAADVSHPDLAPNVTTLAGVPVTNAHGTATASVASAPGNGVGLSGVWPGARTLNVPLDEQISCEDSANGIRQAIDAGAAVINMSYGSADLCYPEYVALQFAVARGIVPVAAAGNEFAEGNPVEYPASLPHVVTVAAIGPNGAASYFSNANVAMDVAAPGEGIPTAVPVALDADHDGYAIQSGTSFAAPMVSAAIAWIRAKRPELSADQAVDVVRFSARDAGRKGYDAATGYGVISVAAAEVRPAGPRDPAEPNDDIPWVDGRMFGAPAPVIYRGRGNAVRLSGTLDAIEDPHDVYRVKVRGRGRVRVTAATTYGHVTLRAFSPGARRLSSSRRRVARSAQPGDRTERITIRNRSRNARSYFVALDIGPGKRLDAGYVLRVSRP